ncbi:PLDc N-terminal domain-containing protein [Pseudochryseolinea flava]|uniref:Cardiolipin synthase N-terminal domain-containing protein n=1 Tax=Pseudochryseolinea flava TaxID=2059302 RepID=A0A364XVQ6_9BACT|nr:PLDc N-terminal domain-containing protein [Pseudochryseolinea flava]RAV97801.1 hypothetical protein DQQ10_26885 [Pseudochryseolinea flava]
MELITVEVHPLIIQAVALVLAIVALMKLWRKDNKNRHKILWTFFIVFFVVVGPLIYLVFDKLRK